MKVEKQRKFIETKMWETVTMLCFSLSDVRARSGHTVDVRISAPVDMDNIQLFTRFYTSQVVQDSSINHIYTSSGNDRGKNSRSVLDKES